MKCKKLLSLMLSCLVLLETPFVSQAASFSSVAILSEEESRLEDNNPTTLNVNLNYDTYTLIPQESIQLIASFSDADNIPLPDDTPTELTWSSDHADIASVSDQGLVSALKAGTAVITCTAEVTDESGVHTSSASCTVTVQDTISLDADKLTLYTCETKKLKANTTSEDTVLWSSSKPNIAKVNSNGKVTPQKAGTTVITATAGNISASCKVTVKEPSLKLDTKKTVYLNNPVTLKATAHPGSTISWKSSAPKIASVNASGKITPVKAGTATITASCNGLKKSCKITVKKPWVKLGAKTATIFAENDYSLAINAKPSNALSYRSSDPKIATVDSNGIVHGIKAGTVTITASVPGAKTSCEITVVKNNYKMSRTSQTIMKGQSSIIQLYNTSAYDSVSFELSDNSIAELSSSGASCTVKARKTGKATLTAYCRIYRNNEWLTCKRTCTIRVIDSGVTQQQAAIAVKTTKKLDLKNVKKPGLQIIDTTWNSTDPKIASVNKKSGIVTGKKAGSAKIIAEVKYSDGSTNEYATNVKISNPQTKNAQTVMSLGHSQKITLTGLTSYSTTKWKIKNPSLVSVNQDGTISAGYTTGKTTLTISVDGKTIKHTIHITNPNLRASYTSLAPGGTTKIPLSGVSSHSRITYKSKQTSIATVNKSGVITAHGYGTATIKVSADGNSLTFQVCVAPQRAIDACKTGYGIMYSSTYSQARRMSTGYYDCSSLVFRAYGCDTKLLGGIPSWAPTAAAMASYMEKTGKVIARRGISASKLRPGDLLFYSSSTPNGRYKNIYHVSMYYGGGYRLEKPLRYYYRDSNLIMVARPIP